MTNKHATPLLFIAQHKAQRIDGSTVHYDVWISPDALRLQALKAAKAKGKTAWDGALRVRAMRETDVNGKEIK